MGLSNDDSGQTSKGDNNPHKKSGFDLSLDHIAHTLCFCIIGTAIGICLLAALSPKKTIQSFGSHAVGVILGTAIFYSVGLLIHWVRKSFFIEQKG